MEKKLETKPDFMEKWIISLSGHAKFKRLGSITSLFFLCQA